MMGFLWCTIEVNDMEESLRFYQEIVGLSLKQRHQAGPGTEIAFLGDGETKIELICHGDKKAADIEGISVGFDAGDLDDKIKFIKEKGIGIESGPVQPNPHVRFFFVRDPNGVKVQFVENL